MSAICRLVFLYTLHCVAALIGMWAYVCDILFYFLNVALIFAHFPKCEVCYESALQVWNGHAPGRWCRLITYETLVALCNFVFFVCCCICAFLFLDSLCVCACVCVLFEHDLCSLSLCVRPCVSPYVCVFIIQGHSIAPHGSIPYPGRHGYRGHLSQRVPADQTGVHPDDVSPRRLLLGTFVAHNAQVLVAASENQQECKNIVLMSQSELVCVCVCVLVFSSPERFL